MQGVELALELAQVQGRVVVINLVEGEMVVMHIMMELTLEMVDMVVMVEWGVLA